MSFPYNQLSTCPTDNSSPLWVLFGPKPLQMPIYCCPNPWPVQSEQKYLGQRLACLAVTPTHLPWNHSLHSLHWTMSLPSSFLFTTQTSIPALVRPTTSSYTKAGTFRAWRGSPRIWLPSVGPGNGMETASSPPLLPVPSTLNYHEPLSPALGQVRGIGGLPSQHQPVGLFWVYTPCCYWLDMEVLFPFVLGLSRCLTYVYIMQAFPWHLEMVLRSHTRVYNANFTHIHSSLSRRGPFGHDTAFFLSWFTTDMTAFSRTR